MEPAVEYKINWDLLSQQSDSHKKTLDNEFIKADDIKIQKDNYGWYCLARSEMNTYIMICQARTFVEFLDKMLGSFSHTNEDGVSYINKESVCAEAESMDELSRHHQPG